MTEMSAHGGAASLGAVASFLGMWVAMTVAMMLPSVAPTLWRFRRTVRSSGEGRATQLMVVAGVAYFMVWTGAGIGIYPITVAVSAGQRLPAFAQIAPVAVIAVLLLAGAVQLTEWRRNHLAHCRAELTRIDAIWASTGGAWRHGLCLGWHCVLTCAAPMTGLLAVGMDLRAMIVVTAAITLERLVDSSRPIDGIRAPSPAPPARTRSSLRCTAHDPSRSALPAPA